MSTDFRDYDTKNLPLVSIAAICYNQEPYVDFTLDSIKAQTYPNIELVIIDDCSQDHSSEKISEWIKRNQVSCKFISHKENAGLCKTLNESLSHCNGKYFQCISCDDLLMPEKTTLHVNLLEKTGDEVAMVFSDAKYIDEQGKDLYGLYIQQANQLLRVPSGRIFESLFQPNYIPATSVLIKQKIYETVGLYDENLEYEDIDMWIRIAKHHEIIFEDFIAAKYRLHTDNMHKSIDQVLGGFEYSLKHKESPVALHALRRYLVRAYYKKHPSRHDMRKKYFSIVSPVSLLNYSILLRLPFRIYYYTDKLINRIKKRKSK